MDKLKNGNPALVLIAVTGLAALPPIEEDFRLPVPSKKRVNFFGRESVLLLAVRTDFSIK